ncbi:hypothetical protein HUA78_43865 [Myxococcus sp. CA033]|uniref:adventurous gliding motility protein AgmC n=1 Tax=Myxococcus sp. CA033 TaxID=2741516 RepID=UPI00157B2A1D|nr:Ig-like domain-containing protein [Myxococcus sp. CA033]NTX41387.1 hypothetical protein [Myxococcus sp. CA033]
MRTLLMRALLWGVLLLCGTASAERDRFGLGGGGTARVFSTAGSSHKINSHTKLNANANAGTDTLVLLGALPELANTNLVMVIQTTGLSPAPAPGTSTPVDLAVGTTPTVGHWEFAQVKTGGPTSTSLTLTAPLLHSYKSAGAQVVTVPRYGAVTVNANVTVTADKWNGSSGGVLAFLANGPLINNGTIQATGLGLRGAAFVGDANGGCSGSDPGNTGRRGEDVVPDQEDSADNSTNGGGGGSCRGGGGGGGGNGGPGGVGGQNEGDNSGGDGGAALSGSSLSFLTFGGGGGSGHAQSALTTGAGGQGGGIIFIRATSLSGTGSILAHGESALATTGTNVGHGGGAGGTLHLRFTGSGTCDPNKVSAAGGNGAVGVAGPGGGGGGGRVFFQASGGASCIPTTPSGMAGTQGTAPGATTDGAMPNDAATALNHAGTVTLVDTAFTTPGVPDLTPVGPPARTNNPLLRGTTQQGLSEVILYEVTGTTPNLTYTYWGRTASDSLKAFVYSFVPPSSTPGTAYRVAAQAGFLGAYSAIGTEFNFTFDNVPPTTTLTPNGVPPISSATVANFTFTSTETSSYRCALDSTPPLGDAAFGPCPASYSSGALGNGDHRLTVYAIDDAGNQDPNPKSYTWKVDTSVPNTAITGGPVASPPGAPTSSKTAVFTFTGGVTYQCSLDVGPATACGPTQTYTNLDEGAHTLEVTAYSAAGTPDPSPASRAWRVDTLAPDTSFTAVPATDSNSSSALFDYQSPDDSTATFQCSVDGVTFTSTPCPGTGSGSRTFTGLTSGPQQFHVRAIDAAGNVDPSPISHAWRVDLAAPASIQVTSPSAGAVRELTPTIAGTTEAGARVVVTVRLTSSGTTLQTLSTVASSPSGNWSVVPAALDQERYILRARATDAAGNFVESSDVGITVDTVAPARPVLNPDILGEHYTAVPITLDGVLESTVGLNPNTEVTVYVDDLVVLPPATVNASGAWSVTYSPSPADDGFHWVRAMSKDPAGNVSAFSGTLTFHVDRKDPAKPIVAPLGTYVNTQYPVLTGTAELGTSVQVYFGPLPEPVTVSVGPGGQWTYLRTTPLNEGPNTVFVRSTDGAGRFMDSDPVSFIVDVTKPETTILEAPDLRVGDTTAEFRLAWPEALTYECRHIYKTEEEEPGQPEDDEQVFTPCERPPPGPEVDESFIQKSNLRDGSQTLLIRAVDAAGNRDDSPASHTWSISTGAVDTEILEGPVADGGLTNKAEAIFSLWSNKGVVDFECKLEKSINPDNPPPDFAPCPKGPGDDYDVARYEGLPDNIYTLSVRAVFAGERDGIPASLSWKVDRTAPTAPSVTAPRANHPTNQEKPGIQGETPEEGTITLYKDGVFWGTARATGATWSFTPPFDLLSGQYIITATLTDLATNLGPVSAPYTLIVDVDEPVVSILSGPPTLTNVPGYTFQFETSEVLETYECALDTPLFTPCSSPLTRPNIGDGAHTLTIRGKDIAGNLTLESLYVTHSWTSDTKTPDTSIETKPKELSNSVEAVFSFGSFQDRDELEMQYFCSLDGADFVSCNPSEYRLTGLGREDAEETEYVLRVKTRDPASNEDPTPAEFRWKVDLRAPGAPSLSVPRVNDILSVRTPTFQGDADAGTMVSVLVDGVKTGEVRADASGDWRFVPRNELDYGSHTVTLVATDDAGNVSVQSSVVNFVLDPSLEIDARGGGLSCASAGEGGGSSLVLLGLGALVLLVGRRRRAS